MNNFKDMLRRDSVLPGDGRSHAGGQDIQVLNDDLSQGITGSHPPWKKMGRNKELGYKLYINW